MVEETEKTKDRRGNMRWAWERLAKATTKEELLQILSQAETMMGDGDIAVKLTVPAKGYVLLMSDAWLAHKYGEIESPGIKELLDRALSVYTSVYLRLLMKSRRERGR